MALLGGQSRAAGGALCTLVWGLAAGREGRALAALPFGLLCVQPPSVLLKRLSRPRSRGKYYINIYAFFFLVKGLSWWMGRVEAWNEPSGQGARPGVVFCLQAMRV